MDRVTYGVLVMIHIRKSGEITGNHPTHNHVAVGHRGKALSHESYSN
jgi:hypothetical protein